MVFKFKCMNGGSATNGEMTVEFQKWLMHFHENKDGPISREELQEAVHYGGSWFQGLMSKRRRRAKDKDLYGFIKDLEIEKQVVLARKSLGLEG